jgi:hypothetical protein
MKILKTGLSLSLLLSITLSEDTKSDKLFDLLEDIEKPQVQIDPRANKKMSDKIKALEQMIMKQQKMIINNKPKVTTKDKISEIKKLKEEEDKKDVKFKPMKSIKVGDELYIYTIVNISEIEKKLEALKTKDALEKNTSNIKEFQQLAKIPGMINEEPNLAPIDFQKKNQQFNNLENPTNTQNTQSKESEKFFILKLNDEVENWRVTKGTDRFVEFTYLEKIKNKKGEIQKDENGNNKIKLGKVIRKWY